MIKIFFTCLFATYTFISWGQVSISPSVLAASAPDYDLCGILLINSTVGEMTAVTTAGSLSQAHITSGFEQPITPAYASIVTNLPPCITEVAAMVDANIDFILYPNPTAKFCLVRFTAPENGSSELSITDISGRQLLATRQNYTPGTVSCQLDLGRFESGIYFLTLKYISLTGETYQAVKQLSIIN